MGLGARKGGRGACEDGVDSGSVALMDCADLGFRPDAEGRVERAAVPGATVQGRIDCQRARVVVNIRFEFGVGCRAPVSSVFDRQGISGRDQEGESRGIGFYRRCSTEVSGGPDGEAGPSEIRA